MDTRRPTHTINPEQVQELQRKFEAAADLIHEVQKLAERNGYAITVMERTLTAVEKLTQECHAAIYVRIDSEPGLRTQLLLFREAVDGFQEALRTVRHDIEDGMQSLNKKMSDVSAVREQGTTQVNVTKLTVLGSIVTLILNFLLSYFLLAGSPPSKGGFDGPPPPPASKSR